MHQSIQLSAPPNRGGVGDLVEKVVSFDCKCVSLVIGDFNDIFSFGRRCGDESMGGGGWIYWLTYIARVAVLVFFTRKV